MRTAAMILLRSGTPIKKEKKIFLIHKDIQMGAVAKSYLYGKGFLIYEEMRKYMRKCANI